MERLAKLILSFVDLAEAEIQSLKKGTVRLCFTLLAIVAGGLLAIIGLCLLLSAAYIALEHAIGRVASLASVGAIFLGVGAYLLISAWQRGRKVATVVKAAEPLISPINNGVDDDAALRIAS